MKKCARCGHVYMDEALNFCLTDGEPLSWTPSSEPTISVSVPTMAPVRPIKDTSRGVSPLFAYLSIALVALLIGGGVVALLLWNVMSDKAQTGTAAQDPQNPAKAIPVSQTPVIVYEAPPAAPVVKVPVPPSASKTTGLKYYSGSVGGSAASFNLVWNVDKTIAGSFFYVSDPNTIYTISGTNEQEGYSELNVHNKNQFIGTIRLNKSIEGNMLCWQGYFSAQNQYVRFCRRR